MDFFKWLSYISVISKIASILALLKAVKATDPSTTPASYAPAASQLLTDDPGTALFLSRLSLEDQEVFTAGLPVALMWLDFKAEKF